MNRFLVFYGDVYYACGGMNDFQGDFDTKEEAINKIKELHKKDHYMEGFEYDKDYWVISWAHIWDNIENKIIYQK